MFIDKISTLYLFWAVSRGLNGGDKFFNVQYMPQTAPWSTKGVVVDANSGEIVYRLHGMETMGLYGVNRDSKTVNYFKQIHLPAGVALRHSLWYSSGRNYPWTDIPANLHQELVTTT